MGNLYEKVGHLCPGLFIKACFHKGNYPTCFPEGNGSIEVDPDQIQSDCWVLMYLFGDAVLELDQHANILSSMYTENDKVCQAYQQLGFWCADKVAQTFCPLVQPCCNITNQLMDKSIDLEIACQHLMNTTGDYALTTELCSLQNEVGPLCPEYCYSFVHCFDDHNPPTCVGPSNNSLTNLVDDAQLYCSFIEQFYFYQRYVM